MSKIPFPQNLKIERYLLSAAINSVEAADKVAINLESSDFCYPHHVSIHLKIVALRKNAIRPNLEAVLTSLEADGMLNVSNYALELHNELTSDSLVDSWIEEIKGYSFQRKLANCCESGKSIFSGEELANQDKINKWHESIRQVLGATQKSRPKAVKEIFDNAYDNPLRTLLEDIQRRQEMRENGMEVFTGYPTGYRDIDKVFDGFNKGHLTLVGARPGVGKTTFMINLILNQLNNSDTKIGIFTLEMTSLSLLEKLLCAKAGVPFKSMKQGMINGFQYQQLFVAAKELEAHSIILDETARIDIHSLRARALGMKDVNGVQMIFIDYLQLVAGGGKFNSKYEEITHISQQMKILAKDLDIPVVCLAQLNRGAVATKETEPRVSDLRDSGSLEQDADEIFLLHDPQRPAVLQCEIAKNRFGATGKFDLYFGKEMSRIMDLQKTDAHDENPERFFTKN